MHSAVPSPSEPETTAAGRAARVGLFTLAVGGLLLSGAPLCPVAYLSGYPCPGCGLTRAGLCLLRGDVRAAVALSPLSVLVVPFVIAMLARTFALYLRGRSQLPPRWLTRSAIVLWVALLVVWILRFTGLFGGPVAVISLWNR